MTLLELFELYKAEVVENNHIIFYHWKTQDGFEINNLEDFQNLIKQVGKTEWYLFNPQMTKKVMIFEYFTMKKTEAYIAVVNHPVNTNAYWKDLPDNIINFFNNEGMFRYLSIEYPRDVKEYIIEFPIDIEEKTKIWCQELFPKSFLNRKKKILTHNSVIFTNSDRFLTIQNDNVIQYDLDASDWDMKKTNIQTASNKFWNQLKEIGRTTIHV